MINKEKVLLSYLRKNSRESLTKISKETGIPVSTIYDYLKKFDKESIVKYTSLIDFQKIGYDVVLKIFISIKEKDKQGFISFLKSCQYINCASSINKSTEFLIEAIFKNIKELLYFNQKIESFDIIRKEDYLILEDIKRESFLENNLLMNS